VRRAVNFTIYPMGDMDKASIRFRRAFHEVGSALNRREKPKPSERRREKERRSAFFRQQRERRQLLMVERRRKAAKRGKIAPPAHPALVQATREAA
jgi:hypothetical protein